MIRVLPIREDPLAPSPSPLLHANLHGADSRETVDFEAKRTEVWGKAALTEEWQILGNYLRGTRSRPTPGMGGRAWTACSGSPGCKCGWIEGCGGGKTGQEGEGWSVSGHFRLKSEPSRTTPATVMPVRNQRLKRSWPFRLSAAALFP